jgi:hypothetical protein
LDRTNKKVSGLTNRLTAIIRAMSKLSSDYNLLYVTEMQDAKEETVLGRLRALWWDYYLQMIKEKGIDVALNNLDLCMDKGREAFLKQSLAYALKKGHEANSSASIQATNQFLKSNTGKMFERFCGLSLAHALYVSGSDYCVMPFRGEIVKLCHGLTIRDFGVEVNLGAMHLPTVIDADLFAFNPTNEDADIFFISVKSTLKDRFHNVPFWNLLRKAALSSDFPNVRALKPEVLERVKYVAVCSDLAKEQPDFRAEVGPRNMLQIDAALLDGAYVTASRARGLGSGGNKIGSDRDFAFYPLSNFFSLLK